MQATGPSELGLAAITPMPSVSGLRGRPGQSLYFAGRIIGRLQRVGHAAFNGSSAVPAGNLECVGHLSDESLVQFCGDDPGPEHNHYLQPVFQAEFDTPLSPHPLGHIG